MIDFEQDAIDMAHAPDDSSMKAVADLCQRALTAGHEAELLENAAKEKREQERRLLEQEIPDAMQACGLASVTLADGKGVNIREFITATPRAENRAFVYGWLREHGLGDLIKNEVTAKFGAGDEAMAEAALTYLEGSGFDTVRKESVHPQTLQAQVRKWLTGAEPYPCKPEEFPEDKFGVWVGRRAEIK